MTTPDDALIARLLTPEHYEAGPSGWDYVDAEVAREAAAALAAQAREIEQLRLCIPTSTSSGAIGVVAALERENRALARAEAMAKALRAEVIHGMTKDPRAYTVTHHLCQLCKCDWPAEAPETHAAGCLAALASEPK